MPTYCVGDIHGCYDHLLDLMDMVYEQEPGTIVFLGDYIDRGPKSKQVLDCLMSLDSGGTKIAGDWNYVFLRGNHEEMVLLGDSYLWHMNGGKETLDSFPNRIMPQEYIDWMKKLKLTCETDDYYFVHAGLRPGRELWENDKDDCLWIRDDFLKSDYKWNKVVVHGHTPTKDIEVKPNRINLDTGAVFGNYGLGRLTCLKLDDMMAFQTNQYREKFQTDLKDNFNQLSYTQ